MLFENPTYALSNDRIGDITLVTGSRVFLLDHPVDVLKSSLVIDLFQYEFEDAP